MAENTWDGAFAKIERAQKHLHELGDAISGYAKTHPAEAISEFKPDRDEWIIRLQVNTAPPRELPLIVGDVVHNLRGVLDYTAWELVWANGNVPDDNVQFPLLKKPVNLTGVRSPGDVDGAALAIIQRVQPCYGGQEHPLRVLRELSNADKHRSLRPVLWYVKGVRLSLEGEEGDVPGAKVWAGAFEDGAELASYPAEHYPRVQVDLHDAVSITLEEIAVAPRLAEEGVEPAAMLDQLFEVATFVIGLFAELRPFLLS